MSCCSRCIFTGDPRCRTACNVLFTGDPRCRVACDVLFTGDPQCCVNIHFIANIESIVIYTPSDQTAANASPKIVLII